MPERGEGAAFGIRRIRAIQRRGKGVGGERSNALHARFAAAACVFDGGAARFDEAAEPLVAAGLLVTGTREKAGREHFLPGPWDAKWGPMETWKSGLYDRTFFGLALPLEPMGALYKKAWDQILAGDLPRFEEAVREKKKR